MRHIIYIGSPPDPPEVVHALHKALVDARATITNTGVSDGDKLIWHQPEGDYELAWPRGPHAPMDWKFDLAAFDYLLSRHGIAFVRRTSRWRDVTVAPRGRTLRSCLLWAKYEGWFGGQPRFLLLMDPPVNFAPPKIIVIEKSESMENDHSNHLNH